QSTNWGGGSPGSKVTIYAYASGAAPVNAQLRFTDFDGTANCGYHMNIYTALNNLAFLSLLLQDCTFNSGFSYLDGDNTDSFALNNNLFERVASEYWDWPQLSFYNN